MRRRWAIAVLVVVALALVIGIAAPARPASAVSGDWRTRMLAQVNAIRAANGVGPVLICTSLNRSARAYATEMDSSRSFGHTGADGSTLWDRVVKRGYRGRLAGENLGAGQRTVAQVMEQWRRSPAHFAVMTDPRFRNVGFGFVSDPSGRYPTYWVQHYGSGGHC
jgi:uncharacterized protein YkwD